MDKGRTPNRLIHEKSPYLLQHAYNPVDWYPWGEEAFARARSEQKPIFLSVGYSTCHWCHVMERESFEVDSIAALMNDYFVCIKVDREERPDVDRIYMTALQAMGQDGGWPMSMFLTPELKPFYGGTYFPPLSRYGRAGFPDILRRIHQVWQDERAKVNESAEGISGFLQETAQTSDTAGGISPAVLRTCYDQFRSTYDSTNGGFGNGPKFPRPVVFNFLLRYYVRTGEAHALDMTSHTLHAMAAGGTYDHLGGGFHRYSVDSEWRVPHFEKMLYDQAQIVNSFVDLYQTAGDSAEIQVIRETLDYVLRDMTDPEGGFYSAEDADSPRPDAPEESGEGAFYVWTKEEILTLLGSGPGTQFCFAYGVEDAGNVPVDPQHEFTGKNILYRAHSDGQVAEHFHLNAAGVRASLAAARSRLFEARERRPRPARDDKVLTSWNGLMISALARGSQVIDNPRYLLAARRAATFVLNRMLDRSSGTLSRRYRKGETRVEAQLADYSFFIQGLLDLFEASSDPAWLAAAVELTGTQMKKFWDGVHGGFFDTSGEDPSILVRMKEQYDSAEPTGNSVAAMNLLRLGEMLDKPEWRDAARRVLNSFSQTLEKQPVVMPQMVAALDFHLGTPRQIIIVGPRGQGTTEALLHEVFRRYLPNKILLVAEAGKRQNELSRYLPIISSMSMIGGKPTAYVCENYACQLPTADPSELSRLLEKRSGGGKR